MSMRDHLGVNCHQAWEFALRLAASLGVCSVRCDANWPDLQPAPDRFTWEWLDTLLATCQSLNLEVYCTLNQTPAWAGSTNPGALPPFYAWSHFCAEFAQHFQGRLTYVSCWNEPNCSPQEYTDRLLVPFTEAFRAVNAGYQICAPDLQTSDAWDIWLKDFLKIGGHLTDVITTHAYNATGAQVWDKLVRPRKWYEVWRKPCIKDVITQAGFGEKPCWITETGWQSDKVGEDGQARNIDQILERFMSSDWPSRIFIYQLVDENPLNKSPVTYGVFKENGESKPAAQVLRRYTGVPTA